MNDYILDTFVLKRNTGPFWYHDLGALFERLIVATDYDRARLDLVLSRLGEDYASRGHGLSSVEGHDDLVGMNDKH